MALSEAASAAEAGLMLTRGTFQRALGLMRVLRH
jgi:hypothetical protein